MDKKRLVKTLSEEDLKGFEEFIDSQPDDAIFPPKGNVPQKKEVTFEHFTLLTNDSIRLTKVRDLILDKLPTVTRYEQGQQLIAQQEKEVETYKQEILQLSKSADAPLMKSLNEIFDRYFENPKN
jgi:hypothetical protein